MRSVVLLRTQSHEHPSQISQGLSVAQQQIFDNFAKLVRRERQRIETDFDGGCISWLDSAGSRVNKAQLNGVVGS